jgi:hypothetical protein
MKTRNCAFGLVGALGVLFANAPAHSEAINLPCNFVNSAGKPISSIFVVDTDKKTVIEKTALPDGRPFDIPFEDVKISQYQISWVFYMPVSGSDGVFYGKRPWKTEVNTVDGSYTRYLDMGNYTDILKGQCSQELARQIEAARH